MDIVVDNLTKFRDNRCVVDGLSFQLRRGEIIGLVGPSGVGKTTLMKMLAGLITPDQGTISYDNGRIHPRSYELKKSLGYLSEQNPLYGGMNVVEFLYFIAGLYQLPSPEKEHRIADILTLCHLDNETHKYIRKLSKGCRQRLGIAQAFLHNPELLILDRPVSGIDPKQTQLIKEIIKVAGEQKTVILSSRTTNEISSVCDRIFLMDQGKITKQLSNPLAEQQVTDFIQKPSLEFAFNRIIQN